MTGQVAETCRRGHPQTPENRGSNGHGYADCRECQRVRQRALRAKLAGSPCRGCGRTGLTLDGGRMCSRCNKRKGQGRPLDGPPVRSPKGTAPAARPKPPKDSKLPKGWYDPLPAPSTKRKTPVGMSADTLDIGPIPVIPPEVSARCLRLLERHAALDLAAMLGVADEAPVAGPQPDTTAKGRTAALRSRNEISQAWLADVDAVVAELGHDGRAVAARLGYAAYGDFAVRLRRLGRRELADALKPPDMRGRTRRRAS